MKSTAVSVIALTALSACASHPMGPTVAVMPAPNKPFSQFQDDQTICKNYADQQVAGSAQSANNSALGSAAIGTILGAGLGAAIGGGQGAAIGAAGGAGAGTLYGTSQSNAANLSIQQRYDIAYEQCMYSRGNQVPGYAQAPSAASQPPGYAPP
ncbi:MAG: glycine zipper family protein, partial [Alphaproteobacteria bacterium]|nr:glycine zipper family protein [Alphaproteobacteria bacterium]